MTHYVGVLDGSGAVWGVRVPDIPGCVGGGETPKAAIADAAEALRDVAAHRRDGGFALPRPSSLTEIIASGEIGEVESAVMMPLLINSGRTVRANVSLDAALLDAIDAAAKARGLSRSAFLASAAREKIIAEGEGGEWTRRTSPLMLAACPRRARSMIAISLPGAASRRNSCARESWLRPTSSILPRKSTAWGGAEKRELISRLSVLLLHLLKWRYQPEKQSPSWEASIRVQRNRLADHLDDNPSLRPLLPQALASAYRDAALEAVVETGLAGSTFPRGCPWTVEQVLDAGFWPV